MTRLCIQILMENLIEFCFVLFCVPKNGQDRVFLWGIFFNDKCVSVFVNPSKLEMHATNVLFVSSNKSSNWRTFKPQEWAPECLNHYPITTSDEYSNSRGRFFVNSEYSCCSFIALMFPRGEVASDESGFIFSLICQRIKFKVRSTVWMQLIARDFFCPFSS